MILYSLNKAGSVIVSAPVAANAASTTSSTNVSTTTSATTSFGQSPPPSVLGKRLRSSMMVEDSPTLHRKASTLTSRVKPVLVPTSAKHRRRIASDKENHPPVQIWSEDVEIAFAEALAIIPKQGLHKIKISGCAKGRNELISDYILAKTGKGRSRKQVSSHIQVVKNLHKDPALIELIMHGPPRDDDVCKRFDEVFSVISVAKSLGPPEQRQQSTSSCSVTATSTFACSAPALATPTRRRSHNAYQRSIIMLSPTSKSLLKHIDIAVKRFRFNYIDMDDPQNSHNFSELPESGAMQPPLRIRTNADLTYRFPRFFELINAIKTELPDSGDEVYSSPSLTIPPIPILHGMVKMTTPSMDKDQTGGQYNASIVIQLTNLPSVDKRLCCLTLIYSFGRLILSTFEKLDTKTCRKNDHIDVSCELRLGTGYWKDFFAGLRRLLVCKMTTKTESQLLSRAIKGITMKQIIFGVSQKEYSHLNPSHYSMDSISKSSIRCVLLWEFLRVESAAEACTTLRKIHLPVSSSAGKVSMRKLTEHQYVEIPQSSSHSKDPEFSLRFKRSRSVLGPRTDVENCAAIKKQRILEPGLQAPSHSSPPSFSSAPNSISWKEPDAFSVSRQYPERRSMPGSILNSASTSAPLVSKHFQDVTQFNYNLPMQMQAICSPTAVSGPIGYQEPELSLSIGPTDPEPPFREQQLERFQSLDSHQQQLLQPSLGPGPEAFESQYLNFSVDNSSSSEATETEDSIAHIDHAGDSHIFDADITTGSFNMMW
ncbi:hypothetical protein FOA43_002563 [Brettanomyces nanus]|uniref:TEA domain-containing protein n=1 Tax=Eeniella nana TaxID=13502 RepID=A0A875S2S5_EENNA|nr:uncharacterized protein FOA43_002563 [Brettanomyces nanus]QPG75213.1 hypothetical protein FOA43_002563 [Brettanomyces nanus]